MENEIMNIEDVEVMDCNAELVEEKSGIKTGTAMLIGAALTCGAIAIGKAVKKVWTKCKAKKEESKQESVEVEIETVEEE